jgi:hypothetical protein
MENNNRVLARVAGLPITEMELQEAIAQMGARGRNYNTPEGRKALLEFGLDYVAWLDSLDPEKDDGLNDLHMLFGAACAVAELQRALPGEFESTVPWKLVLDRRPFI